VVHLAAEFLAREPRDVRQGEPEAAFKIGQWRNHVGPIGKPAQFLVQAARSGCPRRVMGFCLAARFAAAMGRADTNFACCVLCGDSYCRCT
jgi:hypothetical protein